MYLKLAELGFQDTLLRGTVVVTDKSHTLGHVGSNPTRATINNTRLLIT